MSKLTNIYNENYGYKVATNGDFLAVGNPPSIQYDSCEGFGKIGQVFLIRKNKFNSNYVLERILSKKEPNSTLPTYYTEQSSSRVFTASLVKESEIYSQSSTSCSYLVVEDSNLQIYNSNYGNSLDISNYFLAIGDTQFSSSYYYGQSSSYACVDIYKINPNYKFNSTLGILPYEYDSNYNISDIPICSITGSATDKFGYSVSVTDNYLAVGAPTFESDKSNRGCVYIYKFEDADCMYSLQSVISCSSILYPNQYYFGHSICLDKKNENRLIVGSSQISSSNVYVYKRTGNIWKLENAFSQNTSSALYKTNTLRNWWPSGSVEDRQKTRYGYSVSMYDKYFAVGAPNDLIYFEYSGSSKLRQRGSVYLYYTENCTSDDSSCKLLTKLYGDDSTFKDNLFGYSVSLYNNRLLIGSPKPYFPFSSLYISSSINYYDKCFDENDFGESTYCGQSILYKLDGSSIYQSTSIPISKRKEFGKPFNAFGYSVALSDENLIIGAPIPLNDDFKLSGLLITESGSISQPDYKNTSSFQSSDCDIESKFIYYKTEDCVDCNSLNSLSGGNCSNLTIFVDERGEYKNVTENIFGKAYIYDYTDLQKNYKIGNVFYNNSKLILNNTGSVLENITLDPVDKNISYFLMDYQSQVTLFEKQYICTIEPGEFNVSSNPSAITSSLFEYGIVDKEKFDFNNLDLILRYINTKITTTGSEKWWSYVISDDVDQSLFGMYTSSYDNFTSNRLTNEIKNKCQKLDFDVNGDGIVNLQDASIIWKYFIYTFTNNNYTDYINPKCKRNKYDDIIQFLNYKTGKYINKNIKSSFFDYNKLSSNDVTGSYLAPYITTVGLYSGADLVAIAKLAHPIKNTGEIPINIVVKWDT